MDDVAMSYGKPLPVLDPESTQFWEACRRHELKIQRCADCGQVRFPATRFCPHCQSDNAEWIAANGKATVFSWIVVRHPVPRDIYAMDVPYIVALVTLEEGVRMPTNIVGCSPEEMTADMKLKVRFRDVTPEITLPAFAPDRG